MGQFDDWDYEPSDDNAPSVVEYVVGIVSFVGGLLFALLRIAIALFVVYLFVKLVMFLVMV